jgi:hypothetical protein
VLAITRCEGGVRVELRADASPQPSPTVQFFNTAFPVATG